MIDDEIREQRVKSMLKLPKKDLIERYLLIEAIVIEQGKLLKELEKDRLV